MRQRRELGPIAVAQLNAWRAYAARWNYYLEARETGDDHRLGAGITQYHLVCAVCANSIALMWSDGTGYIMTTELTLDNVTRHLRIFHMDLEAGIYERQSAQTRNGFGSNSIGSSASFDPSRLQAEKRPNRPLQEIGSLH